MLSPEQLNSFSEEIKKTGFPWEYSVASAFEKEKWTIINNKYYLDDINQIPREIDLVAYKVSKVKHLEVFTVVIISCKKSDENAWVFLSKKADFNNPNTNWWPFHIASNDKIIKHEVGQLNKGKSYYLDLQNQGVKNLACNPKSEIFAFQEMRLSNGRPADDKAIFSSISSLLHAQSYEYTALQERKKNPYVYQFNLLSVFDGKMVRLNFDNNIISSEEIDRELYISRHIIKKKEAFSRISFLKKEALEVEIADYNQLHKANCLIFENYYKDYFAQVIQDDNRRELLLEDLRKHLYSLLWAINDEYHQKLDNNDFGLGWDASEKLLKVFISYDESRDEAFFEKINADEAIKNKMSKILSKIYRYDGDFVFEDEIPF